MLIEAATPDDSLVISAYSDGSGHRQIMFPNSGTRVSDEAKHVVMNGFEVFSFATKTAPETLSAILEFIGRRPRTWMLCFHQANKMIIDFIAKRCGIPHEKSLFA